MVPYVYMYKAITPISILTVQQWGEGDMQGGEHCPSMEHCLLGIKHFEREDFYVSYALT